MPQEALLVSAVLVSRQINAIRYAELRAGLEMQTANRAKDERVLAFFVQRIPVLPFGEPDAISFGVLRAAVRDRNRDTMDRLIAAHAVSAGLTLVTNNETDFRHYPGLKLENWVSTT